MAATREQFVDVVRRLAGAKKDGLESLRKTASQEDRREIWTSLLRSAATHGRSKGWDALRDPARRAPIAYELLLPLSPAARTRIIEPILRGAGVRMAPTKARNLAANVDILAKHGGPAAFDARMDAETDRGKLMKLLREFRGVGPKYARNLPMDRYHPAFRDSIAIDARIKKVSEAAGVPAGSYEQQERYYLGVAHDAGISGWELDRLLYNCTEDVLRALGTGP